MSDLANKLERLRGSIQDPWTEERTTSALRGVHRRHRRQQVLQAAVAVAGVLVLAVLSPRVRHMGAPVSAPPTLAVRPPMPMPMPMPMHIQLQDGSVATPLTADTEVQPQEQTADHVVVQLVRGSARFRVTHDPRRLFRVAVRDVAVEVLGTQFTVTHTPEQVHVAVEEGRVRVRWPAGSTVLAANEQADFPLITAQRAVPPTDDAAALRKVLTEAKHESEAAEKTESVPTRPTESVASRPVERARPPAPADPAAAHRRAPIKPPDDSRNWHTLAKEGRFEQAYEAMAAAPPQQPGSELAELLLVADVARLSRHPAQAVEPLRRVIREHASDPRASLAAFTLGRVLLDDLGRPKEAAEAFRKTQELDPQGDMNEDALAREVEALWRAGDTAEARARAEDYVRRHPDGRHLLSVRRYGGLK